MPHVTFIHGIANKPPAESLLRHWNSALAAGGLSLRDQGVTTSMVYWADVMYTNPDNDEEGFESVGGMPQAQAAIGETGSDLTWVTSLPADQREMVDELGARLGLELATDGVGSPASVETGIEGVDIPVSAGFEAIPLPSFLVKALMRAFVRDTHHYMFNVTHSPRPGETFEVKTDIRARFVEQLTRDAEGNDDGKHVVVSHSMGTVIAYDCLKNVANCPSVDAMVTIGSPLGLSEIQDEYDPEFDQETSYPESIITNWINLYDRFDPVALDARLKGDYRRAGEKVIEDIRVSNPGLWKHSGDKYLEQPAMRAALESMLEL